MLLNVIATAALARVQAGGNPAQVSIQATITGAKGIIASPRIKTLDRMPAEIRFDTEGYHSFSMKVTPKVNSDGSVTEQLELKTETWSDSKTRNETDMQAVARTQQGVPLTLLIKKNSDQNSNVQLNPPAGQPIGANELKVTLLATVDGKGQPETAPATETQVLCDVKIKRDGSEIHPRIRTFAGSAATIREENVGHSLTFTILPTLETNGDLATKLTFSIGEDLSISTVFHGKSGESATFAYVINGSDGSVKKLDPNRPHTAVPGEIVLTITPKIVSDGP